MEQDKAPERNEVFERIPWEMLEPKRNDRQWLVIGLAGAVVLGALAYSVVRDRPATAPSPVSTATAPVAEATVPPAPSLPPSSSAVPPPAVTAEADLFAVHPERLVDRIRAHAEWFVAEYLTMDGSEQSRQVLATLLPAGIPLPDAPEGVRVFVEWVEAVALEEVGELEYSVTVLARTLAAQGEEPYSRQPPLQVTVAVSSAGEQPVVTEPPRMSPAPPVTPAPLSLVEVPPDKAQSAVGEIGSGQVIGGIQQPDGTWKVVVIGPGQDGVSRPQTVVVP